MQFCWSVGLAVAAATAATMVTVVPGCSGGLNVPGEPVPGRTDNVVLVALRAVLHVGMG